MGESVGTAGGAQDLEILQEHSSLRCVYWAHPGIAWETAAPPLNPCYLLLSVWLQRSANVGANLLLCFPELKRLPSDVSFDSDSCFCKVVLPLLESWKWNVLPSETLAGLILKINSVADLLTCNVHRRHPNCTNQQIDTRPKAQNKDSL